MVPRSALPAVVVAFVLGALVGGIVLSDAGTPDDAVRVAPPDPDDESPGATLARSGPDCLESAPPHSGWLVVSTVVNARAVTYNGTLAHERGLTVSMNVTQVSDGDYVMRFRTTPVDRVKTPSGDCPVGSQVQASTSLPMEYDTVAVVYGDATVVRVRNAGVTTTRYVPVANPVNRTA
jgi:hypothetical protein